jgi:hypothetical protein
MAESLLSKSELENLVDAGLLVLENEGRKIYAALDLWVRHGWYLTFLAHSVVRSSLIAQVPRERSLNLSLMKSIDSTNIQQAMLSRKTTRAFQFRSVNLEVFNAILSDVQLDRSWPVRVFVGVILVDGLMEGVSELFPDGSLGPTLVSPDRETIRRMTIGQKAAGESSFFFWLISERQFCETYVYERQIVELGRIGQRICLAAISKGLGVFTTPATHDSLILTSLGIKAPEECATYLVAIGFPR